MNEARHPDLSMTASRMDSEGVTVSQLLQSLRNETQRCERLEAELQASAARFGENGGAIAQWRRFFSTEMDLGDLKFVASSKQNQKAGGEQVWRGVVDSNGDGGEL